MSLNKKMFNRVDCINIKIHNKLFSDEMGDTHRDLCPNLNDKLDFMKVLGRP